MNKIFAVILAAGKGKRMKSNLPKVLHMLSGKALVDWILDTVWKTDISRAVVVVGHKHSMVKEHICKHHDCELIDFVIQKQLLGTADALKCALPCLPEDGIVFVLCGDVPFIRAETLHRLLKVHNETGASATVLTAILDDPTGYGRIVRNPDGSLRKIVEHRDANPDELAIKEWNSGTYIFDIKILRETLPEVENTNIQGEFYLTDVIHLMKRQDFLVSAMIVDNPAEVCGINSLEQLLKLERQLS